MNEYIVIPKKDFDTLVSRYREALQVIRERGNGFVGAYERELSDLLSNTTFTRRAKVWAQKVSSKSKKVAKPARG